MTFYTLARRSVSGSLLCHRLTFACPQLNIVHTLVRDEDTIHYDGNEPYTRVNSLTVSEKAIVALPEVRKHVYLLTTANGMLVYVSYDVHKCTPNGYKVFIGHTLLRELPVLEVAQTRVGQITQITTTEGTLHIPTRTDVYKWNQETLDQLSPDYFNFVETDGHVEITRVV